LLSTVDGSTLSTHGIDRDVTRRLSGNVDDPINPEGSPIDSEDTESPHVAVKLALSKHQRHHYEAKQLLPLINSALDPFLHLAETVTPHEKNLLRYCKYVQRCGLSVHAADTYLVLQIIQL